MASFENFKRRYARKPQNYATINRAIFKPLIRGERPSGLRHELERPNFITRPSLTFRPLTETLET